MYVLFSWRGSDHAFTTSTLRGMLPCRRGEVLQAEQIYFQPATRWEVAQQTALVQIVHSTVLELVMYPLWFTVYSAHDQSSYTLPATGTVMCKDNRTSCREDFPCDFLVIICEQIGCCSQHVSFNFLGCWLCPRFMLHHYERRQHQVQQMGGPGLVQQGKTQGTVSNLEHLYQRGQERFGN